MKKNHLQKGFTLIETLIAVIILMIVVTSLMTLVTSIISATRNQVKDTTAKYLMQEGLEFIRNNRDSALNGNATWSDFSNSGSCSPIGAGTISLCNCIYNSSTPNGACAVDPIFNEAVKCPAAGCPSTVQVENSGATFYCTKGTQCPGTSSTFKDTSYIRSIRMEVNPNNPDEMFVSIKVSWKDLGGGIKSKTLKSSLFNW